MKHAYNCKYLNKEEPVIEYEKVYSEELSEQNIILRRFEQNIEQRRKYMNKEESYHAIHNSDPLSSVLLEYSNG